MASEEAADAVLDGDDFQNTIPQVGDDPSLPLMIAVSPWQQDIDLMTKPGSNLWNEETKSVDERFLGQGRDVPGFMAIVKNHVSKCFLTGITTIDGKNLLADQGTITLMK